MMLSASTRSHISLHSSFSFRSDPCPIDAATVISAEKRTDLKVWYLIRIMPQKHRSHYMIARRHEDFVQLSQTLHDRFSSIKHHVNLHLPPKIKNTRLYILASTAHRVNDLNQFLDVLFRNPALITESRIVLDFFDMFEQDLPYQDSKQQVDDVDAQHNMSRWERLRCSSFLARAPQPSLSSLCSQAANKIISARQTTAKVSQPSISTPMHHTLKKSQSSVCIDSSITGDTIKIKVIYDVNNIIVVQVPRTIALDELRSRITQKLKLNCTKHAMVLLYNDTTSSYYSTTGDMTLPAILIKKEQDLAHIMHHKWNRLEKVTLRCIM